MANGRLWSQDELAQIASLLAEGGYIRTVAERLDRTPEAVLIKAHKILKA